MPVFRVCHTDGEEQVIVASSLEDAKKLDDDKATQLTALQVLDEIQDMVYDPLEQGLADEFYNAMQQLSDTVTDAVRRHPDSFDSDTPAGKLLDAVNAFLSGRWEG